ncbi:hypothetical protein H4582DRAFT_1909704 [Lactarius indigo]|nr:hypothetical protein H4582DRAFT_1909704 [Lactarius indigo]
MNPSQANSREYQRQAIDAEITSLAEEYTRALRTLKLRRNALAPISSLPPEVLATVFSFLRLPINGTSPLGRKPDRHLSWLCVTHVCQQWREVALNHSLFWSHVDFTTVTPTAATEILVRAKSVPLYLEAWVPKYHWDDARFSTFEKELQPRVSHICQLAISAEPFGLERVLKGLVSPAPTLEYLSLSGKKYRNRRIRQRPSVPDPLFGGSTPRLSRLELRDCDISWKSPLLRGLKHLMIHTLSADARPSLSVWLNALDEMPQLQTLVLCLASPITSSFPFDIERTVALPFLTHFNISAPLEDCGLALAHLVLPALTSLYIKANSRQGDGSDVQKLLPYVAQHARGPQDTRPLQSVLVHGYSKRANILAWDVPDIDVEVHDPPTLLATTLSPRLTLHITGFVWYRSEIHFQVLDAAMAALPLDSLVTLTAQHLYPDEQYPRSLEEQFWIRHAPKWPLLRRLRVGDDALHGFISVLLEDDVGYGGPLLPSLTELVVVVAPLYDYGLTLPLRDALMKRVEEGVPLELLDLRMCWDSPTLVPLLSEIVADVLGPMENKTEKKQIRNLWNPVIGSLEDDNSGAEDDSDIDGDEY